MENELEWNKDLEIGIKEIDGHHKMLFTYLKTLSSEIANERNHDPKDISRLIANAANFTEVHFKAEQELMLEVAYPYEEYKEHFNVHNTLRLKLNQFKNTEVTDKNWRELLLNFTHLLMGWFVSHSQNYDVKFAEFVKKNVKYSKRLKLKLKEFFSNDTIQNYCFLYRLKVY